MAGFKKVLHALRSFETPDNVLAYLKMPPSKLNRVLKSPRFRQQITVERHIAREIARHRSSWNVVRAVGALSEIIEMSHPEASRKACMALLGQVLGTSGGSGAAFNAMLAMTQGITQRPANSDADRPAKSAAASGRSDSKPNKFGQNRSKSRSILAKVNAK